MSDDFDGAVPFRSGCVLLLVLFMVPTTAMFFYAAVDSDYLRDLADGARRGDDLLRATESFTVAGFNIPLLLLCVYLAYECLRFTRKLTNPVAVRLNGDRLEFHPSLNRAPLLVANLADVDHRDDGMRSEIRFKTTIGTAILVKNVEEVAAAKLIANLREIIPPASPAIPPAT